MNWISVDENLPSNSCWVVTFEKMTSGGVNVRWFVSGKKRFREPGRLEGEPDLDATYFVTHWMPVPDPPAKSQQSKSGKGPGVAKPRRRDT